MKNVEIVKQVLANVAYLPALGDAYLSEYSNETQAEILTQARFVRLSVLDELKSDICAMGASVTDILVCPMPMMDNRLSITIVFNRKSRVMKRDLISKCADRAVAMYGCRKIDVVMDLCYCIDGGCDLNLEGLLNANDMDFAHDIAGIHNHLNRETKKLDNWFLPRFAR